MQFLSLGREDSLEEEMTTHCSILAWKIPWTEEPGRLQSMGSRRVRHDNKSTTATAARLVPLSNIRAPCNALMTSAETATHSLHSNLYTSKSNK